MEDMKKEYAALGCDIPRVGERYVCIRINDNGVAEWVSTSTVQSVERVEGHTSFFVVETRNSIYNVSVADE